MLAGGIGSAFADEPATARRSSAPPHISSDAFIANPFAEHFKAGDYARALEALQVLATAYPDDPLVLRYQAITLDRLGRYDEAQTLYDRLLAREPNHVPTRFFRAETYARQGKQDRAIEELHWVRSNSPSREYRQWSEESLRRLGAKITQPVERKQRYLFGNVGWEYDTNVILKSNDPGVGFGADVNSGRFPLNLGIGYRALQRPKLRFDVIYTARQSFNDDGLDEFNFASQELALDLRKRVTWWDRDVTLGSRYEFTAGFLDRDLFSLSNQLRLSSDIRLSPRTRSYFYNRFTVSDYGPDGSNPPQTSRDGFEYELGTTQYFYSNDHRSYLFIGQEVSINQTRGANFTRRGTTTRVGVRLPLPMLPKTELETSVGFRYGRYPRFASLSSLDQARRRDTNWDYHVALTHRLTPRVSTRAFFRFVNADNRNDFYQYDRYLAGIQLLFTQYF